MNTTHQTVLLEEAVGSLQLRADGFYVDATFGRGGHSLLMRKSLGKQGHLLVLDRDPRAISVAHQLFGADPQVIIRHSSFAELSTILAELGQPCVDGVLFDLGVSSPQLDEAERGFSFQQDGPLDMRMDPTRGMSAGEWLQSAQEQDIAWVLKTYGEEKCSKRIARAIVIERNKNPLTRTLQLADLVSRCVKREKHKHPATRTFQAIRIHINQELKALEKALIETLNILNPGGRMAFISFHSLEDRIVKQFFKKQENFFVPRGLPVQVKELPKGLLKVFKKQVASAVEKQQNPRARSAVLRVAEKVAGH